MKCARWPNAEGARVKKIALPECNALCVDGYGLTPEILLSWDLGGIWKRFCPTQVNDRIFT